MLNVSKSRITICDYFPIMTKMMMTSLTEIAGFTASYQRSICNCQTDDDDDNNITYLDNQAHSQFMSNFQISLTEITSLTAWHGQSLSNCQINNDDEMTSLTKIASLTARHGHSVSNS